MSHFLGLRLVIYGICSFWRYRRLSTSPSSRREHQRPHIPLHSSYCPRHHSTMAQSNPIPLLEDTSPPDLIDTATSFSVPPSTPLRKRSSNPTLPSSGGPAPSSPSSPIHKRLKTNEEGDYRGSSLDVEIKLPAEDDANANASDGGEIKSKSSSKTVATQVITGDIPILAMKAEMDGSSFQLFAQIALYGPYVPLSDVEINSLKGKGYTRSISAVLAGAFKAGGTYRRCVAPRIDRSLPSSTSLNLWALFISPAIST